MLRTETARAADGTEIRYAVWGDAPERRVALVHALAMNAAFWSGVAQALGPDWEILAIDCRGHGASQKPAGPYTVEGFADDLAAVLALEGWGAAIIGGASMGGCVAQAFAARHPAATRGLALVDTTAWYGDGAEANWEARGQKGATEGMAALTEFQKSRWFSDSFREAHPQILEAALSVFTANDTAAYLETCRMLGRADLRPHLGGFGCPVEIVVGEEDYATPIAMAEALAAAIPGANLTVLSGVRHFTPLEVPAEIAAAIARVDARA